MSDDGALVVIVHGTLGYPEENWFPEVAKHVTALGHTAIVPRLPTPAGQSLENWLAAFDQQVPALSTTTILIGHSLGAPFALRLLERSTVKVCYTYLISGFVGSLDRSEFDPLNESFFSRPFDWAKIRSMCGGFTAYHGADDPYVALERGREVADHLAARFISIPRGGHLNTAAGYRTFDALTEDLAARLSAVEEALRAK